MNAASPAVWRYPPFMCRNIRPLFNLEPPATAEEAHAAALQYVRKVSGARTPSGKNQARIEQAVQEVAAVTLRLVRSLETTAPRKSRQAEAEKARARHAHRFGQVERVPAGTPPARVIGTAR
jgi:hypothetical protein